MDWKKETLQSIWKVNKERLIFVFCSGLLLFILAMPGESPKNRTAQAVYMQEGGAAGERTYRNGISSGWSEGNTGVSGGFGSGTTAGMQAGSSSTLAAGGNSGWGSAAQGGQGGSTAGALAGGGSTLAGQNDNQGSMAAGGASIRNEAGSAGAAGSRNAQTGAASYEKELEDRIRTILAGVEGVGEVDVLVVLKSSEEKVLRIDQNSSSAVTEEEQSGNSRIIRQQELSESTVLEGQSSAPVVEKEIMPEISGIVISADGGASAVVRTEISEAMQALFGLPAHKIKVLKRVKKGV